MIASLVSLLLWSPVIAQQPLSLNVGVLVNEDIESESQIWNALADYLHERLDGTEVTVRVQTAEEITTGTEAGTIDILIIDPALYLRLNHRFGLSAPIARLVLGNGGQLIDTTSGTLLIVADRADLEHSDDLAGKRIAYTGQDDFDGYIIQRFEVERLHPGLSFEHLETGLPSTGAVQAVLEGRADAAFVRPGVWEQMIEDGQIRPGQLRVLNSNIAPDFPYAVSTALHPGRLVATRPGLDNDLANRITAGLLLLEDAGSYAADLGIHGFDRPYDPVHVAEILRTLALPPYQDIPAFTFSDFRAEHPRLAILLVLALISILILLSYGVIYSRRLRASERRFRSLFENLRQPVMLIKNGVFVDANAAALTAIGIDNLADFHGTAPDAISPSFQPDGMSSTDKAAEMIRIALETGSHLFQWEHVRRNGERFMVEVMLTPIEISGEPYLHVMWYDITSRISAESQIRKLTQAIEQGPAGIIITDLDARIEYVNRSFTSQSGYGLDDVRGLNPRLLKSGKTPDSAYTELWDSLCRGEPWQGELINQTRQGDQYTVLAYIAPLFDNDRKPVNYLAVTQDITALKEAQREASERLHQFRLAIESSSDGFWAVAMDGSIVEVNDSYCELSGYSREQLKSMKISDIDTEHDIDRVRRQMQIIISEGTATFESEHRARDGRLW